MFQQILSNVSFFAIKDFYTVESIRETQPGTIVDGFMYNELLYNPILSKPDKISTRSCKIGHLINELLNGKLDGKIFVYVSNPFYASLILKSVFKALQISEFGSNDSFFDPICFCGIKKSKHIINSSLVSEELIMEKYVCPNRESTFSNMTYMLITSNTITDPTSLIDKFNEEENDNGSKVKILIGSNIISVGYTIKEIRSIHILSMPTNKNEEDQIIKRAVRLYAHKNPKTKVYVYRYIATIPNVETYDTKKVDYTEVKYNNTNEVEKILINASEIIDVKPHPYLNEFLSYEFARQIFTNNKSSLVEINNKLVELGINPIKQNSICINIGPKGYIINNKHYYNIELPYQKFALYNTLSQEIKNYIISYNYIIHKNNMYYYTLPSKQSRTLNSYTKEILVEIYTMFSNILEKQLLKTEDLKKEELINIIINLVKGTKYLLHYKI